MIFVVVIVNVKQHWPPILLTIVRDVGHCLIPKRTRPRSGKNKYRYEQ